MIASRAPEFGHLAHGDGAVLVVVELVADQLLGLQHVRRDDVGSARTAWRSGSPSVSTIVVTPSLRSSRIRRGVDVGVDAARQRAGEHDDLRAPREVQELVAEQLDLRRGDGRAALVDLGLLAAGRVEHRRVRPRLLADAHEVVEDRLLGELLDDARAGRRRRRTRWRSPGWPRRLIARATLTPLPPGMVVWSTLRCRRPSRKFGTSSVLSIAALSVTVMIMRRPVLGARRRRRRRRRTAARGQATRAASATARDDHGRRQRHDPLVGTDLGHPRPVTSGTRATTRPR